MAEVILCSHNMYGFYNVLDFVSELLESSDIVCIQEHWVRHDSISMFDNIFPGFTVLEIEEAVNSLNKSQAYDCNGLNLYNILYAHPAIYVSLKKLFNIMLQFSIIPEAFEHSVITPVV